MVQTNLYSGHWFSLFHVGIAEERTNEEVEFVCTCAPLPDFRKVLDLCCGMGRHARALANRGYSVTGVERDVGAITGARELARGPVYIEADLRDFQPAPAVYDVVIIMSQSFGYFDAATNRELLGRLASGVRDGGRIILDLWNPEFFEQHQGARTLEATGGIVRETKRVEDRRLFVRLDYEGGGGEDFEWQLFTPLEMRSMAESIGLRVTIACTDFDAATRPNDENPRIQFVLQKWERQSH